MREKMSPPPPIPMHLLPSGWKSPDDSPRPLSLPHNLFARDRCVLIILSEREGWKFSVVDHLAEFILQL